MYVNKIQFAGDYVLVSNHTHRVFGAPHHKRGQKQRITPKAMAEYNKKMRTEKLQLLMLLNFDKGYHLTLDYPKDKRPGTYEEAEKNLKKLLYATSRKMRKIKPFKYIAITERGKKRAALHHHVVIEGDPLLLQTITDIWGRHIKISQMYEEGAYKDLAEYLTKIETKEEQTKGKSKYHRSRNLKKPTEKSRIVMGAIPEEPLIPKGFDIIQGSVISGYNEYVGIYFQKYLLRRKPQKTKHEPKSEQKGRMAHKIWNRIKNIFRRS